MVTLDPHATLIRGGNTWKGGLDVIRKVAGVTGAMGIYNIYKREDGIS